MIELSHTQDTGGDLGGAKLSEEGVSTDRQHKSGKFRNH